MRNALLTTAAVLGLGLAAPAFAQSNAIRPGHEPGVGLSEPASSMASNIASGDARSSIAPRLPNPQAGDAASPDQYLRDAQSALTQHKTGQAQEALERAQTRMLDRSVEQGETGSPSQDPRVASVEQARQALGHGDTKGATRLVGQALAMNSTGSVGSDAGMRPTDEQMRGAIAPRVAPNGAANPIANPYAGPHGATPGATQTE